MTQMDIITAQRLQPLKGLYRRSFDELSEGFPTTHSVNLKRKGNRGDLPPSEASWLAAAGMVERHDRHFGQP